MTSIGTKLVPLFAVSICLWLLSWQACAKDTYRVGVLIDFLAPNVAQSLASIEAESQALVGQEQELVFDRDKVLANNFNGRMAEQQYQQLAEGDTDIILAFGPVNNEILTRRASFPKPTILFGAINQDMIDVPVDRTKSEIHNFTYVITSKSYSRDLEAFKQLYDFKKLGVLLSADITSVPATLAFLENIITEIGASYQLVPFTDIDRLRIQLRSVDAIYLAEGFGLSEDELNAIATLMIEEKIPSFTSSRREDVENGWMATLQANENFTQLFRRIALNIEAVINGENLSERPLHLDFNETLTINYNTMEHVGVPLNYNLLTKTDIVGDFNNSPYDKRMTVQQLIRQVLLQNFALQASKKEIELAEIDVRDARSNYLPDLQLSATESRVDPELAVRSNGQNPERSRTGTATWSQTLYSEPANANISIQKSLLGIEQEKFSSEQLDLVLQAATAALNSLTLRNNVVIQQRNLEVTKRNLLVAEQNLELGQSGKADVYRFQSELARNTQNLIEAINQYDKSVHLLNFFLSQPIDQRLYLEDTISRFGAERNFGNKAYGKFGYAKLREYLDNASTRILFVDFLVSEALDSSPEIKQIDYGIAAATRSIKSKGFRRFLPTVAAQANFNRIFEQSGAGALPSDQLLEDNYNLALNFSVPLFNRNNDRLALKQARLERSQLELNRASVVQDRERSVRDGVIEIINQIANLELSGVSEKAAIESLRLTESAYVNGAVTVVELIDAQNSYLQAQRSSVNANYNLLQSAISLERQLGYYYFLLDSSLEMEEFQQRFEDYMKQRTETP